jgi:hypothetical protein
MVRTLLSIGPGARSGAGNTVGRVTGVATGAMVEPVAAGACRFLALLGSDVRPAVSDVDGLLRVSSAEDLAP